MRWSPVVIFGVCPRCRWCSIALDRWSRAQREKAATAGQRSPTPRRSAHWSSRATGARVICGLRCWLVGKTVDGMDAQAPSAIFSGTLVDVCRDLSAGLRTPSGEVLRIEDACQQLSKKSSASAPTLVTQGHLPARYDRSGQITIGLYTGGEGYIGKPRAHQSNTYTLNPRRSFNEKLSRPVPSVVAEANSFAGPTHSLLLSVWDF